MQPAGPDSVLGDFDGAEFEEFGVVTRFRREGERYWVETAGEGGARGTYEVAYTFGVEPLQQYLIAFPKGRLQSLTIAWDTRRRLWFSLYPDERLAPDDPLHWTGPLQRWNSMCGECHSTQFDRGYDVESGTWRTRWVALDVTCQACHGPSAAHVAWAESLPPDGPVPPDADRRLAASAGQVEVCAPCHSRRQRVSAEPVAGDALLDHYVPELLRPGLYFADGQIQDEVYVYGSFVQSRMFERGVVCSDCHEPHGLGLRAEGNDLCTRCHAAEPEPRFPSLKRRAYDTPDHHFHRAGSEGARCVACHMPARTYMQVDDRRDHSLRVPRPDLSARLGTPNACTGCHADRDDAWAAGVLAERGVPTPPHFGETLAAARSGAAGAVTALVALAADRESPAIARATALGMLVGPASSGDDALAGVLLEASRDGQGLVRLVAAAGLEGVAPERSTPALARLVSDPLRAVRVEAARVLAGLAEPALSGPQREHFGAALDEYRDGQAALSDTPEAHLNLGVLHARRGRAAAAERSFRTAIELQPDFVPARVNLANLLNGRGSNDEAVAELRRALASYERLAALMPASEAADAQRGELHYSLGLVLAETGELADAELELRAAAAGLPGRSRVHFNHGLALQQLGRASEAEAALLRAEALAPDSPDVQNALAIFFFQQGDAEAAARHAERLVDATDGAPAARELLERVRAAR